MRGAWCVVFVCHHELRTTHYALRNPQPTMINHHNLYQKMKSIGIGFAGIEGAWWLPATAPFALPLRAQSRLSAIGSAMFSLLDVVGEFYDTEMGARCGLNRLMTDKVPAHLLRYADRSPVDSLRPDFQLVNGSSLHFSATELEICPSAQGYAHAMQVGYELTPDLADAFAHFLQGRTLWFVASEQWSEFIFEQLAFCRALHERGAMGRVLYDLPIARLADSIRRGERWQPPIFGVKQKTVGWDDDLIGRVERAGLMEYLHSGEQWPEAVGEAVVFRFGYLECFERHRLERLQIWQERGATFLNPLSFLHENKTLLAALHLPEVRAAIRDRAPTAIEQLSEAIPETYLLTADLLPKLLAEQSLWILKFAGFDAGNQAWGGRSLQIGAQLSPTQWAEVVSRYLQLPFPVVAQRLTPSQSVSIDFVAANGEVRQLHNGTTRLRTFFLRQPDGGCAAIGSHITVSGGTLQVSESTDAVQTAVVFVESAE